MELSERSGRSVWVLSRASYRVLGVLAGWLDGGRMVAGDRGWGKAPIQIDLNVRAKFDDFLRDVGVLADHQRDQGLVIEAGVEAGLNGALEDEIEDLRPITDE